MRAHLLVMAVRVALWALPFTAVRYLTGLRLARPRRRAADWPRVVGRAVDRAARTFPGASCLVRALVAERMLVSGGHATRLTIGVALAGNAGVALDAHAWVESGGHIVVGDEALERYASLHRFDRTP